MLSFIKILISLIKYIPQVILNIRRKSTIGWSIWNVLLDFTGGILSDLQLVLDCADLGDWTGITGNLAKFGLGFVSVTFDLIFMLQHYVLYRHERSSALIIEDLKSDEDVA
jgi:cystinosin